MSVIFREMIVDDYEAVLALWQSADGVGLSESDSREKVGRFLDRNPGLSFLAWVGDALVGAVLCGHDGRRGYINHLVVGPSHRRRGIGRALVERCLRALRSAGIDKCHIFVFADNQNGIEFWQRAGWTMRVDLTMLSHYTVDVAQEQSA